MSGAIGAPGRGGPGLRTILIHGGMHDSSSRRLGCRAGRDEHRGGARPRPIPLMPRFPVDDRSGPQDQRLPETSSSGRLQMSSLMMIVWSRPGPTPMPEMRQPMRSSRWRT